jgi:limonene-1,2-epoxide hydrolase
VAAEVAAIAAAEIVATVVAAEIVATVVAAEIAIVVARRLARRIIETSYCRVGVLGNFENNHLKHLNRNKVIFLTSTLRYRKIHIF